jgi:RNA-binding protein
MSDRPEHAPEDADEAPSEAAIEHHDPEVERLEAAVAGCARGELIQKLSPKRTALHREKLRRLAHEVKPIVMVGRGGLSDGLVAAIRRGLLDHELIKVKLLDAAPVSREAFALWVHEKTKADAIAWVGRTVIFYQKHPEKPKIHLPG